MLHIELVRHDTGIDWREDCGPASKASDLVLVTYGKCMYRIAGKKFVLEKGDVLLIPGCTPFYGTGIPTITHEKAVVRFSKPEPCPPLPILQARDPVKWKPGAFDLMADRIKSMQTLWTEKERYFEVMGAAVLLEILVRLNREIDSGPYSAEKRRAVEAMKAYIQNRYREKITKETLSGSIGKSPNYTATLFRQVTGQTISDYVHRVRVRTAVYLLRHSALTVAEISDYLGYSDPSYFHKIFKGITGSLPSDLLKEREEPMR